MPRFAQWDNRIIEIIAIQRQFSWSIWYKFTMAHAARVNAERSESHRATIAMVKLANPNSLDPERNMIEQQAEGYD